MILASYSCFLSNKPEININIFTYIIFQTISLLFCSNAPQTKTTPPSTTDSAPLNPSAQPLQPQPAPLGLSPPSRLWKQSNVHFSSVLLLLIDSRWGASEACGCPPQSPLAAVRFETDRSEQHCRHTSMKTPRRRFTVMTPSGTSGFVTKVGQHLIFQVFLQNPPTHLAKLSIFYTSQQLYFEYN